MFMRLIYFWAYILEKKNLISVIRWTLRLHAEDSLFKHIPMKFSVNGDVFDHECLLVVTTNYCTVYTV